MNRTLPFATSSRPLDRRRHSRLLAGVLLGLGLLSAATAAPSPVTALSDSELWARAVGIARASRWFLPGQTVIEETTVQDKTTARSRVTARFASRADREPEVSVTEIRIDGRDVTGDQAAEVATALEVLVEKLFHPEHPLALLSAADTRPVGEKLIDGARCRGFETSTPVNGLTIVSTTWIDVARGFARRIDYHAAGLPLRQDGAVLRELDGSTEYTLDAANRWLLVRHHERSDAKARALLSSIEIRSDRTLTCEGYWEYHGARREQPAPATDHASSGENSPDPR